MGRVEGRLLGVCERERLHCEIVEQMHRGDENPSTKF